MVLAVPTTEKEYNDLAKKPTACVEDAVDHTVYHSTLSEARLKAVELIEAKYKAKRREVGTGKFEPGEDGKPVEVTKDEGFDAFLSRVATENKLPAVAPFADIFKAMSVGGASEVKFDPSVQARTGGGLKLAQKYVNGANQIIAAKAIPAFAARYEKITGKKLVYDTTLTGEPLVQAIGKLAREMKLIEEERAGIEAFTGKV